VRESISATFRPPRDNRDEWGARRKNFGLVRLFGCSFDGKVEERVQNSYLTVHPHPLTAGLDGVPRVIGAVKRVHVKPASQFSPALTLIPSYPDLPMEDVFPRVPRTDIPMAFTSEHGKGRVVYFPILGSAVVGPRAAAQRAGVGHG
jgi:hypothetical protein